MKMKFHHMVWLNLMRQMLKEDEEKDQNDVQ